jgi:hypothetical protein
MTYLMRNEIIYTYGLVRRWISRMINPSKGNNLGGLIILDIHRLARP